jgi:A/G-specific adenine glycosylase
LVVEVLLQRTNADVVDSFARTFLMQYPDWDKLAAADVATLAAALRPIGLQRRRAASLHALACAMQGTPKPENWDVLPGVGQYISRALAVAIDGDPVAMVDSNFVRVIRRAFSPPWMSDYRYDPRLQELAGAIVRSSPDPRSANWAVLDLGALICLG